MRGDLAESASVRAEEDSARTANVVRVATQIATPAIPERRSRPPAAGFWA